ncbi:alpha/beta hydrolase [Clostridium sp. SHJSY1]|uniref:alpha/beta hydrolase n=1 Tax=Clostridium sp. SHJSY1 TaxID=2942483 RepID=UPI00287681ED|nr:alpha/beta hydrolase [Clostridium sp. SHJSY1]MDS0527005.1 alpha/beta hydrolase [Clostridium sp. SHJSY1]
MKKFFKYFLLLFLILAIFTTIIFRNRLSLYYTIYKQYDSYKDELSSLDSTSLLNNANTSDLKKESIQYKNTRNTPVSLDIYRPDKSPSKGSPVLLYVHGGSWAYGSNEIPKVLSPILKPFLNQGYTIISVSYELLNKKADFSKQVADVKDSIKWIYKNKDTYNFNTDEIGVIGISAGAHLSLLATYSDTEEFVDDQSLKDYPYKIKYLIDFFGPTDLSSFDEKSAIKEAVPFLLSVKNKAEYIKKYSPINYVKKDLPKTLIVHSKADTMVPYNNSSNLYESSKALGNNVKLVTLNNTNHDLSNLNYDDSKLLVLNVLTYIINNSPL